MSFLNNWTNSNSSPVCADGTGYPTWVDWEANQRDLFILDHEGNVVFHENISGGLPSNLNSMVMDLVNQISDCDSDLMCGEALTCCDGMLYPTTCCSENCDEPIDVCEEEVCTDGEVNNDNPCNPMECFNGQWVEIVIDCAEQMGVPCEGGVYIPPEEGTCCSICVLSGDINNDGQDDINLWENYIYYPTLCADESALNFPSDIETFLNNLPNPECSILENDKITSYFILEFRKSL